MKKKKKRSLWRAMFGEQLDIRHRLLNLILLSTLFGGGLLIWIHAMVGSGAAVVYPLSMLVVAVIMALFVSIKRKQPQIAAIIFVMVTNVGVFPVLYFAVGGIAFGIPIWQVFGLIISWILLRGSFSLIIYLLNVAMVVSCIVLEMMYPEMVSHARTGEDVYLSIIEAILMVTCIFGVVFKYQIFKYESQNKQLEQSEQEKAGLNKKQMKLLEKLEEEKENAVQKTRKVERLSEQIMLTLANTIDAKDKYTNGHSTRVGEYAREIARRAGKSKQVQREIYYVGLLHDIGKIGIPITIINKKDKLTEEEYKLIKDHTKIGSEILSNMTEIPGLSIGARWHHELYDGTGYPDGLKGKEIPEIARLICVADAYDAMSSKRSYRDVLPQAEVRRELTKGIGTQFDPYFAKIMLDIMDEDVDYLLCERDGH